MKKLLLLILLTGLGSLPLHAQSYAFGVKGGLTLGVQNWDGFDRDPLYKYHGILFIESAPEGNEFALFAQAGYHVKGSAIRNRNFRDINGNTFRPPAREFRFNNVSLSVGGKQKYDFTGDSKFYYMFGIRGDYTVNTNLGDYSSFIERYGIAIYPIDSYTFINRFNYGAILGGGIELPFTELVGAILEFSVNPDFSYQYRQPEIGQIYNHYTGQNGVIRERKIRNVTFELTLGFRFVNKVVYID